MPLTGVVTHLQSNSKWRILWFEAVNTHRPLERIFIRIRIRDTTNNVSFDRRATVRPLTLMPRDNDPV